MKQVVKQLAGGALAVTLGLGLSACAGLGSLFGPDAVVKVQEVGRAQVCAAQNGNASVQRFASADAVLAWQNSSGVTLIGEQAMLPGEYALVEMGQRGTGGYGFVIAPEAEIESDVVRLRATFFEPTADTIATQALTSPCVLVRLPQGSWRGVEVYDQNGKRRARALQS
jgi:hypothetical protein